MTRDERIARERLFHDDRFSDDSARAAAGRFYELADAPTRCFQELLENVEPDAVVLDYGAGTGSATARELAGQGCKIHGIDISPVAIDMANASACEAGFDPSQVFYEVMNAEQLSFPDNSFDLVFGSGILHHLDLEQAIPELARVLKPSGRAVFLEPMGHNPLINLYRRCTPKMRTPDEHPLLASDLSDIRRSFGLVSPRFFALTVFGALPLRRTKSYGPAIQRLSNLDSRLFDKLPGLRRFGWIVVLDLRKS